MKLKTSFFDKATFRKDITRFWPVWVLYTVALLLLMLPTASNYGIPSNKLNASLETWAIGNFLYAALVSQLLFGDLYSTKLCYAIHAMPATRTARFVSHISAGMLFSLVPNLVCSLLMMPTLSNLWYTSLLWLAVIMLQYLCFFGIGVLSMVCTGKRLAAAAVYGIINLFSLVIYAFLEMVIVPMMYGVELVIDPFLPFSPVAQLATCDGYFVATWVRDAAGDATEVLYFYMLGDSWGYLFLVAAIGAALLAVSLLMYRRRKLESAGSFIASRWLSPVFLTLYTLCAGVFVPVFSSLFLTGSDDYTVSLIVGLVAGFFTGKMLLARTVRIFKKSTFIQFAIVVLVAAAGLWAVKADVFGIVSYVPEKEDIAKISQSYEHNTLTEEHQFEPVIALHQWAVEHPCDQKCGAKHQAVSMTYTLHDGRTIKRHYRICVIRETNDLIADYKSAYAALDLANPNFVPDPTSIANIHCTINGVEYKQYDSKYFEVFTKTHKLALETDCDGSCGNAHSLFEITYTLADRETFFRKYAICHTEQFLELLAPLHYSDVDFMPEAKDVKSATCRLDNVSYAAEAEDVISIHKLALAYACSGDCGQGHTVLEISYWMKVWDWDKVKRTYKICDNEQGKEIIALIVENLSRSAS